MSEKATYLAVIAPLTDETRGLAASPETRERARMQVWGDVSAALEPLRGEVCGDFQPAAIPWEHPLEAPFSVVLGQSEAALFLLYYALANNAQQEQMRTVGDRLIAKGVTLMEKKLANDTIVQVESYVCLSLSEKIRAGLEVAELIKKLVGVNFPVFIDNTESVPVIDNVQPSGQVFLAKVAKGVRLQVQSSAMGAAQGKAA